MEVNVKKLPLSSTTTDARDQQSRLDSIPVSPIQQTDLVSPDSQADTIVMERQTSGDVDPVQDTENESQESVSQERVVHPRREVSISPSFLRAFLPSQDTESQTVTSSNTKDKTKKPSQNTKDKTKKPSQNITCQNCEREGFASQAGLKIHQRSKKCKKQ